MGLMVDKITEPQKWIDELLTTYAPYSEDVDVALQNMGLKIKRLEKALMDMDGLTYSFESRQRMEKIRNDAFELN